jgi:hypothetical protein
MVGALAGAILSILYSEYRQYKMYKYYHDQQIKNRKLADALYKKYVG